MVGVHSGGSQTRETLNVALRHRQGGRASEKMHFKCIVFCSDEDLDDGSGVKKACLSGLTKVGIDPASDGGLVRVLSKALSLDERAEVLNAYRDGKAPLLLVTPGMASRGIDVPDTSNVIMMALPDSHDEYVHQAGRTGRCGRGGKVTCFVLESQEFMVERYSNEIGMDIVKRKLRKGSGKVQKKDEEKKSYKR